MAVYEYQGEVAEMRIKINWLMVLMSTAGGFIAFLIGELLLAVFQYKLPDSILEGLYFGILALIVGSMCLLAEILNPEINGTNWRKNYVKTSFKLLIPCTLVAVFTAAALFQFVYELSALKQHRQMKDFIVLIDTSKSMSDTDPDNERFNALNNLMDSMNSANKIAVIQFSDRAQELQTMNYVTKENKKNIMDNLDEYRIPDGKTNMRAALDTALKEVRNNENTMVIMLSDGGDNYDLDKKFKQTMKPFTDKNIPVYTVGVSDKDNFYMLKKIADYTNGEYYEVKEVKNIKNTFIKIYNDVQQSLLNDKRVGIYRNNVFYAALRIIFITLLAALISASVSFVLDNKFLLRGFVLGGLISGIASGIILESGLLYAPLYEGLFRAVSDVLISFAFTMFSVTEVYRETMYENVERFAVGYTLNNAGIKNKFH